MKHITCSISVVGACLAVSAVAAQADDWSQNLYINADAGAIFQQDTDFHQSSRPGYSATFNPGVRTDLAIGYNLNQSFAVELEPGFMWNSVDKLNGDSLDRWGESIDMYHVPVLANLIYKFPTMSGWTPYVGVGAGVDIGTFEGSVPYSDTIRDTTASFAFQGEAGVRYAVSEHSSVGVAYKFLGTTEQKYDLDFGHGDVDHAKFDAMYIHGIFLNYTLNF